VVSDGDVLPGPDEGRSSLPIKSGITAGPIESHSLVAGQKGVGAQSRPVGEEVSRAVSTAVVFLIVVFLLLAGGLPDLDGGRSRTSSGQSLA